MSRPRISAKESTPEDARRTSPSDDGGRTSPGRPATPPPEDRENTNLHTANCYHSSNRSATVPSSSHRVTPANTPSNYSSYTQTHNEYSSPEVPLQSYSSRSAYPATQPDGTYTSTGFSSGQRTDGQREVESGSLANSSSSYNSWTWSAPHNNYYIVQNDATGKPVYIWAPTT